MATTQQEVIKKFMAALDRTSLRGTAAINQAVKACSKFNSVQEVIDQMVYDCKNVGNTNKFLKDYCGIILNNKDTGAITGSDAGGAKVKTADSIVPESGSLKIYNNSSFTVNGLTVKLGKMIGDSTVERSYNSLSNYEKYLWHSMYSYWIKNGLNLVTNSYGSNYSFNDSAVTKTMYVVFANEGSGNSAVTYGGPQYAQKSTNPLKLHINFYYYNNATGKNGEQGSNNPAQAKQTYLDRTIAHELTHAAMRAHVDYYDYLPAFAKEGLAELVHGIDDESKNDIKRLASNPELLKESLDM